MTTLTRQRLYPGEVTPPPAQWRSFAWDGGLFQAARRPYTEVVEGVIASSAPILMTTLRGGAERHEFRTADGLRYDGPDRAGAVSFLPGGCERRLRVRGVAWHWASISLAPGSGLDEGAQARLAEVGAFCDRDDPVLSGLLCELDRLHALDGTLDVAYCDAVAALLAGYLVRKFGGDRAGSRESAGRLAPWQLRRIDAYVREHLHAPVRIAALARLIGTSEGHLQRGFRLATGETPLRFVNRRRIERAIDLMRREPSLSQVALQVGFTSPTAFARTFRSVTGRTPSAYRGRFGLAEDGTSSP